MAVDNKGVMLRLMATSLATAGLLGFGMKLSNGVSFVWPIFFMSLHSFFVPFASQASLTYVIDCDPKDANPAFVTRYLTKAVFTFIVTTYAIGGSWCGAEGCFHGNYVTESGHL
jgi:hypothetical protein